MSSVQEEGVRRRGQSGQQEMPFALVQGQPLTQLPLDLYIPPDALEVILEQFEGPLDLLLYLIRKQNLDILEVNVSEIVDQYIEYMDLMQSLQLELAGEYLVMAAMLAEIKSRVLLPRNREDGSEGDEEDPRAELIRRLQEYERFKTAAENLDELPRLERDIFTADVDAAERIQERVHPEVDMKELMLAFAAVLRRAERFEHHEIQREQLSTRERMSDVLDKLKGGHFMSFGALFEASEGKLGVVVTFLAILELVKEALIDIVQQEIFGPIHVRVRQERPADGPSYNEFSTGDEA
ncbi:segregation and condensation protein A [Thalassolituus sp. LLYu03]|uniref:segregation and condensation protein A n=1 Tax=Thalassolituus sp. LLYu03 TaxID=3421656 RepID=UPI003D2E0DF9